MRKYGAAVVALIIALVLVSVTACKLYMDLSDLRAGSFRERLGTLGMSLNMAVGSLSCVTYGVENLGKLGDYNATLTYIKVNLYYADRFVMLAEHLDLSTDGQYSEAIGETDMLMMDLAVFLDSLHSDLMRWPNETLSFMNQHLDDLNSLVEELNNLSSGYLKIFLGSGSLPSPQQMLDHALKARQVVDRLIEDLDKAIPM